jgi:hypothetical protein
VRRGPIAERSLRLDRSAVAHRCQHETALGLVSPSSRVRRKASDLHA